MTIQKLKERLNNEFYRVGCFTVKILENRCKIFYNDKLVTMFGVDLKYFCDNIQTVSIIDEDGYEFLLEEIDDFLKEEGLL